MADVQRRRFHDADFMIDAEVVKQIAGRGQHRQQHPKAINPALQRLPHIRLENSPIRQPAIKRDRLLLNQGVHERSSIITTNYTKNKKKDQKGKKDKIRKPCYGGTASRCLLRSIFVLSVFFVFFSCVLSCSVGLVEAGEAARFFLFDQIEKRLLR